MYKRLAAANLEHARKMHREFMRALKCGTPHADVFKLCRDDALESARIFLGRGSKKAW